jgi:hypothetical protein
VQFELKVFQIQTIFQNLYSNNCQTLTSNLGLIVKEQPASPAAQQPAQLNIPHCIPTAVALSLFPFSL